MSAATRSEGPGALVIGSDYKSLGVVRSLGRQGIRVWVLNDDHVLAPCSRYCERSFPWRAIGEAQQVEYLLDLARDYALEGWTIFPTQDEAAALLARNREVLGKHYRLGTIVPWSVLRWTYDKRLTYRLAEQLGVPYPHTSYPRGREDVLRFDGAFPVILKPAVTAELNRFTAAKAWPAADRASLVERYDEACALIDRGLVMIQELIPGGGQHQFSYAALCRAGEPVASVTARRVRQWPMDFGRASTYVESVTDREVEDSARRLLAALRFEGIIEVEFKRDPRDGVLKLLDMNPRVWGWHTLGRRAGVDFPYLLWLMMSGAPIAERNCAPGIRWVRALTDVPTALNEIRAGRLSAKAYLSSLRGPIEFAVLAADDLMPALIELPATAYLSWKRRRLGAPVVMRDEASRAAGLPSKDGGSW